jgi:hypothetical protein
MVPYFTRLSLRRGAVQERDRQSTAFVASHLDYQNASGLVAARTDSSRRSPCDSLLCVKRWRLSRRGKSDGDMRIVHSRVKWRRALTLSCFPRASLRWLPGQTPAKTGASLIARAFVARVQAVGPQRRTATVQAHLGQGGQRALLERGGGTMAPLHRIVCAAWFTPAGVSGLPKYATT